MAEPGVRVDSMSRLTSDNRAGIRDPDVVDPPDLAVVPYRQEVTVQVGIVVDDEVSAAPDGELLTRLHLVDLTREVNQQRAHGAHTVAGCDSRPLSRTRCTSRQVSPASAATVTVVSLVSSDTEPPRGSLTA